MPKYIYKAKNLTGEEKSGSLDAENERELAKILHQDGYLLIKAELEGKKSKTILSISLFRKVSLVSKLMFVRNLRVMVSAGVPLPRAFSILSEQTKSKKLRNILLETKEKVLKGKPLSESLRDYPDVFSDLFVSMIRTGEETGTLEDVLIVLADQMEKDYQLRSRIKGAMVYPIVIVSAMVVIGVVMMIFVVPKLAEVFEELNAELPLTTRIIMAVGDFLASFWYLLPIALIAVVFVFKIILKTRRGKLLFDIIALKIPVAGGIIRKANSAYFVRTLSSLVSAGVPVVESFKIASSSLSNTLFKEAVLEAAEKIKKGSKMSEALDSRKGVFPSLVIQMIEVGGETGETSDILKKLAEFFEEEVTNLTRNLSTVIEPILMIIIGAAVAFFAISMMQPIYGIMGTL